MKRLWRKFGYIILLFFIIGGFFDLRIAFGAILCMMSPILLALLGKGRFWCKYMCPRGIFYDQIISHFSEQRSTPRFLRTMGFRLSVIIMLFYLLSFGISKNLDSIVGVGLIFYKMMLVSTAIGVLLAIWFNHRAWCSFCPVGSMAQFITFLKRKNK